MPAPAPVQKLRFRSHDTRRNLPAASARKRGESNFLRAFERVWLARQAKSAPRDIRLASGREFGMDGFGRADLVFVTWQQPNSEDFTAVSLVPPMQITAFEAKISDWRKGLMQASRYRYFATCSVLVLPPKVCVVAARYLPTFQTLGVGLWEFDKSTDSLVCHFTPSKPRPLNSKAHEKAVQLITDSIPKARRVAGIR